MKIAFIVFCLTVGLVGYAVWWEPYRIQVRNVQIDDPVMSEAWDDILLMHISDLHVTDFGKREKKLLLLIENYKPDLILITGDISQWFTPPHQAIKFINRISAPLGVYGVLGDADLSLGRAHCLFCHPAGNMHQRLSHPLLLRNEVINIPLDNGGAITIAGLSPDLQDESLKSIIISLNKMKDGPVLCLSHFSEPWSKLKIKQPILFLSGDTHGGQILLPSFLWRLIGSNPDTGHIAGLYKKDAPSWLYINRGLGTTKNMPFRLGVRPEVTLINFHN